MKRKISWNVYGKPTYTRGVGISYHAKVLIIYCVHLIRSETNNKCTRLQLGFFLTCDDDDDYMVIVTFIRRWYFI